MSNKNKKTRSNALISELSLVVALVLKTFLVGIYDVNVSVQCSAITSVVAWC